MPNNITRISKATIIKREKIKRRVSIKEIKIIKNMLTRPRMVKCTISIKVTITFDSIKKTECKFLKRFLLNDA